MIFKFFHRSVTSLWRLIAKEENLASEVCSNLLCQLASSPPLEEPRDERSPRVARAVPLAVSYAKTFWYRTCKINTFFRL